MEIREKWVGVPEAKMVEFATKCGEACSSLRRFHLVHGPDINKKAEGWVVSKVL